MLHTAVLEKLWKNYTEVTPSAYKIHDLLESKGDQIENDHIAFRTFDHPKVNIAKMAAIFEQTDYVEKGEYHFEAKKLYAKHFEHATDKSAPKIFISELKTAEFSPKLQAIVKQCVEAIPEENLLAENMVFSGRSWGAISHDTYHELRAESEYAAWLYVYGFRANHFTVFVNRLESMNSLEEMNAFLKENGFPMNVSGGEIKGTPDELLEQSSILADKFEVAFEEGSFEIPSCYYEFARRYCDHNDNLYEGFIAKSADKIFESTDLVAQ